LEQTSIIYIKTSVYCLNRAINRSSFPCKSGTTFYIFINYRRSTWSL